MLYDFHNATIVEYQALILQIYIPEKMLEPIREDLVHVEAVAANRRSMMRIMAMLTKAAAMRP